MMFKNIVFDIDGTLIDTEKAYMNSLLEVLNDQHHLDFTYDQVVTIFGIPAKEGLESLGIADKDIPDIMKAWYAAFADFADLAGIFDGIINTLKTLQTFDVDLGIVTSKTLAEFKSVFDPLGLTPVFNNVVTASDTKQHKPGPEPLLKMIEISDIPADQTLYIGDTKYDLDCAHGAGVKFGLAGWGAHNNGQFQDMDYFLSRPAEIIDLVR
ncbi:HAD family hydrolase [Lapidilactobacillus bayanensis]|uniref:HAD family hydrolase n=1 Tax=Lapidilactobacillus bayanensis TaxID=2485998 RepID=UPI0013DE03D8|nr:HAD family hydrolase [Lapidilactobacillus bayanensis]